MARLMLRSIGRPMELRHMAIKRWDPYVDLMGLQPVVTPAVWAPPVDIYETPDTFRVVTELPGFDPDQVDVTVNDGTLTIRAERKFYDEVSEESFHRVERRFGQFESRVALPLQVEADKVEASFDRGVLTVSIPKVVQSKPRRVEIKAQS